MEMVLLVAGSLCVRASLPRVTEGGRKYPPPTEQLRPPSLLVEGVRMLLRSAEPQPASQTPACSVTCGAASADLGLSAGSPIGLLYDFPEVCFVPLGALPFRAPLGLLRLPGTLLGCPYAPQPPGVHRVHELHVGSHRLLRDRSRGLRLALLLVGQLLGHLPVLLGLGAEVAYHSVEELPSQLGV